MNGFVPAFVAATSLFTVPLHASDLELTIRAHSARVQFGDPLYIEVTIVNRGKETVTAPLPHPDDSFGFRIHDPKTELQIRQGGTGGFVGTEKPVEYLPGKAVKHYWRLLLPGAYQFDHVFWKPVRAGQTVRVWGVFGLRPGLALTSNSLDIVVENRDVDEMQALEHWATTDFDGFEKGPSPADLGLYFKSALTRSQTDEFASKLMPGDFQDLLLMTIQFKDIYAAPVESRAARDRGLVEWLKKQPDIKRQELLLHAREIAGAYHLSSTLEALKQLGDLP